MYKCNKCGEVFDEPESREETLSYDPVYKEYYNVCPYCGSEDFEDATLCSVCGNEYITDGDYCEFCKSEMSERISKLITETEREYNADYKTVKDMFLEIAEDM